MRLLRPKLNELNCKKLFFIIYAKAISIMASISLRSLYNMQVRKYLRGSPYDRIIKSQVKESCDTGPLSLVFESVCPIEEGFIQKPRQTVVLAFWGKMATHMLLLRLCSRQIVKRQAGSKLWGDICILHIL